jgi:hypothetical protein
MKRKRQLRPENLQLKYKLHDLMLNLNHREYSKALEELPGLIGKSKASIHNYRYIPFGSKASLPYEAGLLIEKYFNILPGTLLNDASES